MRETAEGAFRGARVARWPTVVGVLLIGIVARLHHASADIPNPFEPKLASSTAIAAAVEGCADSARKHDWGNKVSSRWLLKYCGCMIDVMVFRGEGFDPSKQDACAKYAERTASQQKPSRTPFQARRQFLTSEQIYSGQLSCEARVQAEDPTKSFVYRMVICSCITDLLRYKRTLDAAKLPRKSVELCEVFAADQDAKLSRP